MRLRCVRFSWINSLVAVATALGWLGAPASAAVYTVIDLTPAGYKHGYGYGIAGNQQVGAAVTSGIGLRDGVLWTGTAGSAVNLRPTLLPNFTGSINAFATNGAQQVGDGFFNNGGNPSGPHALLWSGSGGSAVDLNPTALGAFGSAALSIAIVGNQQSGYAQFSLGGGNTTIHAMIWSGTAASATDLHPNGYTDSIAYATNGVQQTGYGLSMSDNLHHALLWSGTAASATDLKPTLLSGFGATDAFGIGGNQQAGSGSMSGALHALLWSGTAASAVDLNPSGFSASEAKGTNGLQQVGYGILSGHHHALVWDSSSLSFIDLHVLLGAGFTDSDANGIDATGNIMGSATDSAGNSHAIEWALVPDPSSSAFFLAISGVLLARRTRRK